jgi:hypothetical protein
MSTMESLSPGSSIGSFRLGERIGNTVWQAEDTRNGKRVAVKLLTRSLPKDPQRRDAMVREARQNAALYHVSLVGIIEIAVAGDMLLLVMDFVDGMPLSKRFANHPADRAEFFRIAYQAVDVLKLLHIKNLIHANLNGDSLLTTTTGQVKVAGLNLGNLLPKKEGPVGTYQQKGSDIRCVSYMAPEQIQNLALTQQSDIWSLGVVLYEVGTGRLPYTGESAPEIARKIVEENPSSPKGTNPNIDTALLSVMGRCLFKDPFKRHKDAKTMLEDIVKADPEAQTFANDLAKAAAQPAAASTAAGDTRNAVLFLADVASYEALQASDPAEAARAAARMQQVLGEAAYLFDGQVLDPFAPRLIAEMPSIENALEAARKGEFDFSPEQQDGDALPVRLLLHAGSVSTRDGAVVGDSITKGFEVVAQLPPQKLYITEEFAKRARGKVRLRDAAARAGVKLYEILAEPKVELPPEPTTAEIAAEDAADAAELAKIAAAKKKKQARQQWIVLAVAAGVVAVLGLAWMAFSHKGTVEPVRKSTKVSNELPPATPATPRKVYVTPFAIEGADPTLAPRASSIRLAAIETLRAYPEIRITDNPAADVLSVTPTLRAGAAGPELALPGAAAIPVGDVAGGVPPVVQFVTAKLNLPPRISTTSAAMNAFGDAVSAVENAKIDAALRTTLKADPKFLPAQLMAMRFFTSEGKNADAVEAAKQVVTLDPSNMDAAHAVVTASLAAGDLTSAFNAYGAILKHDPKNADALNTLGRYALAAGDTQKFGTCLARVRPDQAMIHEPDVLVAAGRIDAAADKYYDVKVKNPGNVALSLKIGRLSVLRHGVQIAEDELKNQQSMDPKYGAHILQAYIYAQGGNRAGAQTEMEAAKAASKPGDEYYTDLAEVAALAGDPKGTVDALENAANHKEPTAAYVLASPLFTFLQSDARFNKVREKMTTGQGEIRAALGGVAF